jgi:hypothetical protein
LCCKTSLQLTVLVSSLKSLPITLWLHFGQGGSLDNAFSLALLPCFTFPQVAGGRDVQKWISPHRQFFLTVYWKMQMQEARPNTYLSTTTTSLTKKRPKQQT